MLSDSKMPLYEPLSDEEVILASVLKQALRGTFTSNLSEEKDASRKKKDFLRKRMGKTRQTSDLTNCASGGSPSNTPSRLTREVKEEEATTRGSCFNF